MPRIAELDVEMTALVEMTLKYTSRSSKVAEWGRRKWRFSVHSVSVFGTFYIHGHTIAFR